MLFLSALIEIHHQIYMIRVIRTYIRMQYYSCDINLKCQANKSFIEYKILSKIIRGGEDKSRWLKFWLYSIFLDKNISFWKGEILLDGMGIRSTKLKKTKQMRLLSTKAAYLMRVHQCLCEDVNFYLLLRNMS